MSRPLRIEFSGALYHVTSRGNDRKSIFYDDVDRRYFLHILGNGCERYDWLCHAYCLMGTHYHLLVETGSPTLSKGMKYLNGCYTQKLNHRHSRVGHVFQGRFKAILVQNDAYLLELARYIVLNPVRARMVRSAGDWPWSSYRATAGMAPSHACLSTDGVLAAFSQRKREACENYRIFVEQGKNLPSPWEMLKNQIYLGSDQFVEDMLSKIDPGQSLRDISNPHKNSPPKPLDYYQSVFRSPKKAMAIAYLSGHYSLEEVGQQFGVSYATVSRAVKAYEIGVKCKA